MHKGSICICYLRCSSRSVWVSEGPVWILSAVHSNQLGRNSSTQLIYPFAVHKFIPYLSLCLNSFAVVLARWVQVGLAAGVLEAAQLSPGPLPCRAASRKVQVSGPEQCPGSAECELCHQSRRCVPRLICWDQEWWPLAEDLGRGLRDVTFQAVRFISAPKLGNTSRVPRNTCMLCEFISLWKQQHRLIGGCRYTFAGRLCSTYSTQVLCEAEAEAKPLNPVSPRGSLAWAQCF